MSVEINVEVTGTEELKNKLQKLDSNLKRKLNEKLADIGSSIRDRAYALAPFKTGRLRASIYCQLTGWTLKVGAKAPYARYLEFGTRWIKPRQFLSRALTEKIAEINRAFHEAVYSAVSEASI